MFYYIDTILKKSTAEECLGGEHQYVAVLSPGEWIAMRDAFEMGIDIEPDTIEIYTTNAEVNYDSVTGTFSIPDRNNMAGDYREFAFALDEKGIVFIDSGDSVEKIIAKIIDTKKWRFPSLERFIYDFLEQIIHEDSRILENYEKKLDVIEDDIERGKEIDLDAINDIKSELTTS